MGKHNGVHRQQGVAHKLDQHILDVRDSTQKAQKMAIGHAVKVSGKASITLMPPTPDPPMETNPSGALNDQTPTGHFAPDVPLSGL